VSLAVAAYVAAACTTLFSPVYAQTVTAATITGLILETSAGLPVAGATVALRRGSQVIATTTTSSNGSFALAQVAPGNYTLLVSASRFQTQSVRMMPISASGMMYAAGRPVRLTTAVSTLLPRSAQRRSNR
jgi:Carboxypeptidase regulatory-like domain